MKAIEFGTLNNDILILLHGGGLSWWNYRDAAKLLSQKYRVILPILDGHAGSGQPFRSIEENAEQLVCWIDKEYGGQVTAIAGVSLGGQIAVEMLSIQPDICRFALLESTLAKPMPLTYAMVKPTYDMSFGLIRKRWFAKIQADYLGIPEDLFEDYYRDTCEITKPDMIAFLEANSGYAIKPALPATNARVLILAGSRELKQIRDSAALLHKAIPGSSMRILPGYRHGELSLNHGQEYATILDNWIQTKDT